MFKVAPVKLKRFGVLSSFPTFISYTIFLLFKDPVKKNLQKEGYQKLTTKLYFQENVYFEITNRLTNN